MMTWPRRGLIGNSQQNKSSGGMLTPRSFDASVNTFSDFGMLPWGSLYTTDLVSDNTNFFSSRSFHVSHDGRYLFVYYAGDDVIRFPLSTPYDISTKSLNPDQTLTDSTLGELNGSLVSWSNDGYHMYVAGSDDDNLQDWQAETPWSLTNIRYGGRVTFDNFNLSGAGRGVFWRPNGERLFIVTSADNIYQFTLTSAWDMTTVSYDGSRSISSDVSQPYGLHFSSNGDKVFVMDYTGSHVAEFSLGTNWDVTATGWAHESDYATGSIANGNLDYPDAFAMSNDGTKFYGTDGSNIYQWTLDVAWDLDGGSGPTFNGTRSIGGSTISGLSFTSDGTQLVMSERGSNLIRVFSLSTAYDIEGSTTVTQQISFSPNASHVPYNVNDSNHWYKPDFLGDVHVTNDYLFLIDADASPSSDQPILHRFNLKVSDDPTSIDHGSHDSSNQSIITPNSIHWTPDGKKFIIGQDSGKLYHYTTSIPWNPCRSFVTYDGYSIIQDGIAQYPGAVVIAPDGKNILALDDYTEHMGQGYLSDYFESTNGDITYKFITSSYFYNYLWLNGDYDSQCAQISANHEMLYILSSNTDILQLRLQTY